MEGNIIGRVGCRRKVKRTNKKRLCVKMDVFSVVGERVNDMYSEFVCPSQGVGVSMTLVCQQRVGLARIGYKWLILVETN